MYRYGEYCPLAKTTTVIGDYWTPLIVRELLHGRQHFNELVRSLPDISRSLLAARLKALERGGVVDCTRAENGKSGAYRLTEAGLALRQVLDAMSDWGERFEEIHASEADMHPMTAVCMLRARVQPEALPDRRVVAQISTAPPKESLCWLVLENRIASLCTDHPGFEVDLFVSTDVATLYRIWRDEMTVTETVRRGRLRVEGAPVLARAFPTWFGAADPELAGHFEAAVALALP